MNKADLVDRFGPPVTEEPHPACTRCGGESVLADMHGGETVPAPCWCVVCPRDQFALLVGWRHHGQGAPSTTRTPPDTVVHFRSWFCFRSYTRR
mgnify:CR=1 FL=1